MTWILDSYAHAFTNYLQTLAPEDRQVFVYDLRLFCARHCPRVVPVGTITAHLARKRLI